MNPKCFLVAFFVCGIAASACANMGSPVHPGQPVGEPAGELKGIAIVRETLSFDFRPLQDGRSPAVVEAEYRLRNHGAATTTDLLFVAGSMDKTDHEVWLDGVRVESTSSTSGTLPENWLPPGTTPSIGGDKPLAYSVEESGTIAFTVTIAPGEHTLRVRYGAVPTAYSHDSPTVYWQLGYVL
ncbi:MAG TPA: hypothetical protein VK993_11185, partial [Chthoniobacterales bacterium]|nr:hypothetical protein [Chthoniobacterales bacterium]